MELNRVKRRVRELRFAITACARAGNARDARRNRDVAALEERLVNIESDLELLREFLPSAIDAAVRQALKESREGGQGA